MGILSERGLDMLDADVYEKHLCRMMFVFNLQEQTRRFFLKKKH